MSGIICHYNLNIWITIAFILFTWSSLLANSTHTKEKNISAFFLFLNLIPQLTSTPMDFRSGKQLSCVLSKPRQELKSISPVAIPKHSWRLKIEDLCVVAWCWKYLPGKRYHMCCVVSYYIVLYCVVSCCVVLCCVVLCFIILFCVLLSCVALLCVMLLRCCVV